MPENVKPREVVVIGGGLAGSAAAIRLAQNGKNVLLLEKEPAAHDKVCGEFIVMCGRAGLLAVSTIAIGDGKPSTSAAVISRTPR